jgi:SAM-dependent methyltransferase
MTTKQLVYGNWIRRRILMRLGAGALVAFVLAAIPIHPAVRLVAAVLFIIMLVSLFFPLSAYIAFSSRGGNFQEKVFDQIVVILGPIEQGQILDIGTGNGILAIKLAMHNRRSKVTAIDYWGEDWEYAKELCERNAEIAEVSDRIQFAGGDAAALDFDDSTFDAIVSNLTFHEVDTAPDKREVLAEALRILKVDGRFTFVDYFFETNIYGQATDFEEFIEGLGIRHHELRPIGDVVHLSSMLRHPRVLGRVGVLSGTK